MAWDQPAHCDSKLITDHCAIEYDPFLILTRRPMAPELTGRF